ncbi:unnamed protein product [Arctia plantaginis]|uniref:Chemosensory protein n=1 Tax=Arctia plantaginis TaxID=874455 RepID=A0A8S0ZTK2_ARCPL|nr:unnamed protein product [Arctia plantaginis]CAB3234952.1 unnamed protein product [Arctia plantaginis]
MVYNIGTDPLVTELLAYFHRKLNLELFSEITEMIALFVAVFAFVTPFTLGYDEIYDKLDVDKILADDALFTSYINCLLDKGECSVEHSADFRKLIPEVIATACAKCTDIQKTNVRKTVKALTEKRPTEFDQFRAKFDPKSEYEKAFTAFVMASD